MSTIDTLSADAKEFQMPSGAAEFQPGMAVEAGAEMYGAGAEMYDPYGQYAAYDGGYAAVGYQAYAYVAYPIAVQAMPNQAEAVQSQKMEHLLEALGSDQTWSKTDSRNGNHMQLCLDDFSDMSDSDASDSDSDEEPGAAHLAKKEEHTADEDMSLDSDSTGAEEPDSEPGASSPSLGTKPEPGEPEESEGLTCSNSEASELPPPGACSEPEAEEEEVSSVASSNLEKLAEYESLTVQQLLHWRYAAPEIHGHIYAAEETKETPEASAAAAKDADAGSWRRQDKDTAPSWGAVDKAKLAASENSWAAQNRARKAAAVGDEHVTRSVKAILNKITVERFSELFGQMLECGLSTPAHAEMLIQEVFEKATQQHHFIDMYADLCVLLQEHFTTNPFTSVAGADGKKPTFKRLLLDVCQASFERLLAPPEALEDLEPEERSLQEVQYKTRMLGNIKLVGALLVRQMLAGKVGIAIMEELLTKPTPEALESLAALLTVVGGCFDRPEWQYRAMLCHMLDRIKVIVQKRSCSPRVRCLLKDLLDLRANGWQEIRPRKLERPTALAEVAEQQQAEKLGQSPCRKALAAPPRPLRITPKAAPPFEKDVFRAEATKVFMELRHSGDVKEAVLRLEALALPPAAGQPEEVCEMLSFLGQEGSSKVREQGFKALAEMQGWQREAVSRGVKSFLSDICPDLCCDVPALPKILAAELRPALSSFIGQGLLEESDFKV
eukprot:CAMPEP_0197623638 /NCGR_PEP_ID=MMETSP1338-20131121/3610_1 /TAXON_ID=43686 ORGANISM="Pelagodinium beii, Strain RCC1491" /NCGR_SAMPLE_ID=MMETSP1338 /ASSEMBLY_ACC=CAM_ASM_000754 /LENGTH=723 /DNA_ID=CAMNT_0043193673 /DNA_START=96 /DNA_END=2267 /DNA_ORIENTATION=+